MWVLTIMCINWIWVLGMLISREELPFFCFLFSNGFSFDISGSCAACCGGNGGGDGGCDAARDR